LVQSKNENIFLTLQDIFLEKSAPLEIRYLAIIKLKNGIDKYWRKYAANAISKEEKKEIRDRLLQIGVNEADPRLALQNALVTAKIARNDHPLDWPNLFKELTELLKHTSQSSHPLHLSRCLLIVLHVIKELATGRLQRTKVNLQSSTPEVFRAMTTIYSEKMQIWLGFLKQGGHDEGGAIESLDQSLLAIRVLRRLTVVGFEFPNRAEDVQSFWSVIRGHFEELAGLVTQHGGELVDSIRDLVEKHILQYSKLHVNMAVSNPTAFGLLPDAVGLTRTYWSIISEYSNTLSTQKVSMAAAVDGSNEDDEKPLIEKLSLKGLMILRECIKMVFKPLQTFKYRHQEEKDEQKQVTELMKSQLLQEQFVREMMNVIVEKFFVFRQTDLVEWQEDAEEWERKEEHEDENWEYAVRPCTERLFLDLVTHYKDMLTPPLISLFETLLTPSSNVLARDASYTALGLAAAVIHEKIPFDRLIQEILPHEITVAHPDYVILRRRIPLLIKQWITIKVTDESRPIVYGIFQRLLDNSDHFNDLVVRITAGKCFKAVIDEWDFVAKPFLPFLEDILNRISSLIEEVHGTDTKLALINTLSVMVEQLRKNVRPIILAITAYIHRWPPTHSVLYRFCHLFGNNLARSTS
jgi:hypothetical protein